MGMGTGTALRPAMAAASPNTAHRPRPLPAAASASRPTASAPPVRTLVCTAPPRRAAATTARAAGAGSPSSASPDAVTYSSSIDTDMPLYEPPGVSFDEYLQDRPRVFRAMFPDESRSQQLSDVTEITEPILAPPAAGKWAEEDGGVAADRSIVSCAGGVEDPDAAAGVPPHHRAPRRRDAAAQPRRRRARPPNHRVGAEGAGQRVHAGELRPGRAGVAVRGQGPTARQPAEGPPRDLHHRRPPAAPADRAGGRSPGRRRVGPVDACGEDEAGRGRRPRRRLPEVPAGEGGVRSGGGESRQKSLKARVFFLLTVVGDSFQRGLFL